MFVIKRNNRGFEYVDFNKIHHRITRLSSDLDNVNSVFITQRVISNLHNYIETTELDKISAKIAYDNTIVHPDYSILASRLIVSNLHKQTPSSFSKCMEHHISTLDPTFYKYVSENHEYLDSLIVHERDYKINYFGYMTLEYNYLKSILTHEVDKDGKYVYVDAKNNKYNASAILKTDYGEFVVSNENKIPVKLLEKHVICDRPQYMYLRVAIAIYLNDLLSSNDIIAARKNLEACYDHLSNHRFTHATPTLFNAGCKSQQMLSCFLVGTSDSVEGIMNTIAKCSVISKFSGGIGVHISNIRSAGQSILTTGGKSSGIIPQCMIYNSIACCWDQGGKRKGAIAMYLEPHHADIMDFLQLKLNNEGGHRARDLFYALWISDLFMECVMNDSDWYLFSENTACGLSDVYDGMMVCIHCKHCYNSAYAKYILRYNNAIIGEPWLPTNKECIHDYQPRDAYTYLYNYYKNKGLFVNVIKARNVYDCIATSLRESGGPYICFKDHVNRQSNHSNVGTIKSSNLCTEIMQWSSHNSFGTCTLASINLTVFLNESTKLGDPILSRFDFAKLHDAVRLVTRNLDAIIDVNKYPSIECESNALKLRPIGIGIQGLADLFIKLEIPYISEDAQTLDVAIAETIYHASLCESIELAKKNKPYQYFTDSILSNGILACDNWTSNMRRISKDTLVDIYSGMYDWDTMRTNIKQYGVRNSLVCAYMPTVSTSQILGNTESFEPIPSCIYNKTTLKGKFIIVNESLQKSLSKLGLWNEYLYTKIINNGGSIQDINEIPQNIKDVYKTVWDIPQSALIRRAAIRGAWIDQAQSLNVHLKSVDPAIIKGVICTSWKLGLKTGIYYIRSKPAAAPIQINIKSMEKKVQCTDDVCTSCTS